MGVYPINPVIPNDCKRVSNRSHPANNKQVSQPGSLRRTSQITIGNPVFTIAAGSRSYRLKDEILNQVQDDEKDRSPRSHIVLPREDRKRSVIASNNFDRGRNRSPSAEYKNVSMPCYELSVYDFEQKLAKRGNLNLFSDLSPPSPFLPAEISTIISQPIEGDTRAVIYAVLHPSASLPTYLY
jgi:hypothetical protein